MSKLWGISAKRIVTCDPARATKEDPLGVVTDGVVLFDGHSISWVGPRAEAQGKAEIVEHGDRVVTPGLVDAHTHAAWMGSRHDEYVLKITGADYRAIAAAGGGILSTFRAVSAASEDEVFEALRRRLFRMVGVLDRRRRRRRGLLRRLARSTRCCQDRRQQNRCRRRPSNCHRRPHSDLL